MGFERPGKASLEIKGNVGRMAFRGTGTTHVETAASAVRPRRSPAAPFRRPASRLLTNNNSQPLSSHHQRSAARVNAYSIELNPRALAKTNPGRALRRPEIINELNPNQEQPHLSLIVIQILAPGISTSHVIRHSRIIRLRNYLRQRPAPAAVISECQVRPILLGMFIVAARDHAVIGVAERNRKNPLRVRALNDRSIKYLPASPAIARMKDPCNASSGGKPDIGIHDRDASITGGECAFTFHGRRKPSWRNLIPRAPVGGHQKLEF